MNFKDCLSKGLIRKDKSAPERVKKSLEIAERFLSSSKKNIEIKELEMSEIASYNSIFHAARSLLFNKGYIERSHVCVIIALRELYIKEDKLNVDMIENLELCMNLRHEADYGLTYHQESAETAIKYAEDFLNNALKLD